MEDDLTPTLVNSYGSAKHTVINSNGQSVVYWNPLQASGTVEGVTWESRLRILLKESSPKVLLTPFSVCSIKHSRRRLSGGIEHHSQANCQGCL